MTAPAFQFFNGGRVVLRTVIAQNARAARRLRNLCANIVFDGNGESAQRRNIFTNKNSF
jgi:hypothetical protein